MGQGREIRRYPGGLGRSRQPNQGAHTPESEHSDGSLDLGPSIGPDFTKLYLRDTGEKTPAHTLPLTGNTA